MNNIAVIATSGFIDFPELGKFDEIEVVTPFDDKAVLLNKVELNGRSVYFLCRHAFDNSILPHCINYRANIWALKSLACAHVIAVNTVGGISNSLSPKSIVVPDQIIDYTYGRMNTYADHQDSCISHIDFTWPFTSLLREALMLGMDNLNIGYVDGGVYACTQGPRLESAAEINRLERDGSNVVGMTAMPEATLARELNLNYASICVVVNWAAGIGDGEGISMQEVESNLTSVLPNLRRILVETIKQL